MRGGEKINYISNLIIPILVLFIILYGFINKVDVYDTFIEGVKDSFLMIKNLFPTFLAMILAINLFTNSGFLNYLLLILKPVISVMKIPIEILPMIISKPISGSASLAYLNNIFETYGPDSILGTLGSVIQGCTDTTFYVIGLYFGSVGIKKIRYSLFAGLVADLIGIVASIVIVNLFFH